MRCQDTTPQVRQKSPNGQNVRNNSRSWRDTRMKQGIKLVVGEDVQKLFVEMDLIRRCFEYLLNHYKLD